MNAFTFLVNEERGVKSMYLPTIQGVIDRRILVNYRIPPALLEGVLPRPFRPKLVHGMAIAGFCLIRLKQLRPRNLPGACGLTSENAAHRIAVEWDEDGKKREGVYIPIRHTSSRFNALIGGRIFPGLHEHATFEVVESNDTFSVNVESDDHTTRLRVEAQIAADLPQSSLFSSLQEVSTFFEEASLGYSATTRPDVFEGLELRSKRWQIEPLQATKVVSSFFDDPQRFPAGSVELDCVLLMHNIAHEWHAQEPLCIAC
jgi:hypothetical protein